jgi:hypothetical protein
VETRKSYECLWTSVLCFFLIVFKLVQAFVISYDQIFQALAVEGDILLLQSFLDPTPPTIEPQLGPVLFSHVCQTEKKKISETSCFLLTVPLKPRSRSHGVQKWLWEDVFYHQGLEKSHLILWQVLEQVWKLWKNRGLMSKDVRILFLSPSNLHSRKK